MDDAQIRKIVGSRASWMMRWGILWAFAMFLCIYCVMYEYTYKYEKEVKGFVRDQSKGNVVRLYTRHSTNLREKEIESADSIRLRASDGKNILTTAIRLVQCGKSGCYIEYIDPVGYAKYQAPHEIDAVLIITRMNLLDIIFKDVGKSAKIK